MARKVLVVGASGFIGKRMVSALQRRGVPMLGITSTGNRPLPGIATAPAPADCGGFRTLLDGCSAVVHVAARSTPASSSGRPGAELRDNLTDLLALLEAMQSTPGVELLYFSSGGSLYPPATDIGSTESTPLAPRSYHGAGKAAAELFIRTWSTQFGNPAVLLRPSNVYGPGQLPREGFGVIPNAMLKLRRGEPLTVWGDGSARRDYLFVDDLIDLALRVLDQPMPAGAMALNASSGSSLRLDELLAAIEAVAGSRLDLRFDASRTVDASNIAISSALAHELYGWRPETPIDEGLRRTWEWLNTVLA